MSDAAPDVTINVNVGVLGHVDSGKTSLVRALSTELSTAALDKHPQSQERGITLDLGFSGFFLPAPASFIGVVSFYTRLGMCCRGCIGR
jgi:selenocysteine-specific elongation factor